MNLNKQIRVKPEVKQKLFADQIKTAKVAEFVGISVWTLRYRWLQDDNNQTTCQALFIGISKVMKIAERDVKEEFIPIQTVSTIN